MISGHEKLPKQNMDTDFDKNMQHYSGRLRIYHITQNVPSMTHNVEIQTR